MQLSLIAMSGSGKSYWSAKLAQKGFRHFDCDRMIASKLGPALKRSDGAALSLGEWMGFPYQPGYRERETQYLEYEKTVLGEIFKAVECESVGQQSNFVIDTTGSVIYTGKTFLDKLRRLTKVVYLETDLDAQDRMLRAYLADPRPVLWQGKFVARPGEENADTLARCYPELLSERIRLYRRYAHIAIPYKQYREEGWRVTDFLETVQISRQG